MTHTTSVRRRPDRLIRFGLAIAAGAAVTGAIVPSVLAQTLPVQTVPLETTSTATQALTVGQTQALTRSVTEGPYFKANSPETTNLGE